MSYSPSLSVVRLQELKLWQGSYDNLLQKSRSNSQLVDENSKENISPNNTPNVSLHYLEGGNGERKEWDKRKISPAKPFEQLLEEKMAEETPVPVIAKPKKPFLKKGQGLSRFRMGAARPTPTRSKTIESKRQVSAKFIPSISLPKTPVALHKSILKKPNPLYHQSVDLSPLTIPDFVKPRGTWQQVLENTENDVEKNLLSKTANAFEAAGQETLENYEEFRKSLGSEECKVMSDEARGSNEKLFKTSSSKHVLDTDTPKHGSSESPNPHFQRFNRDLLEKINDYANKRFPGQKTLFSNDIPENVSGLEIPKIPKHLSDLTLEELRMERELRIFEALEKRADSSSFSSTNTSVANLLASTPRKFENILATDKVISELGEQEDSMDVSVNSVYSRMRPEDIQTQIKAVTEKADVLQQFLMNLRTMDQKDGQTSYSMRSESKCNRTEKTCSTNTSFSDEDTRWSTRSPSLADNTSEFYTTTSQNGKWKGVDAGVNTSFDKADETLKTVEACRECEELRLKSSETKRKLTDFKSEYTKLKTELRDIEKEYDKLKKILKKNEEKHREQVEDLENELDSERKKITREKAYFESYVKDSQNRPSKKEREEITQLKQELADVKELLKLKDTKTGATQARLRTQIKQQEKELSEMKITVEKLQRENAKLTASQKYSRRPQEVKMLHEINKNLSKLAEDTLKKQLDKSGNGDTDEKEPSKNNRRKSDVAINENAFDKENVQMGGKTINNNKAIPKTSYIPNKEEGSEGTLVNGVSIEQQYENVFGNFNSPRRSVDGSSNIDKVERTLADGSIEITYSNGNLKTLSADGKLIKMKYFNGDIKETNLGEQIIKYHYAVADSWHIQYPDGTEVMEFKDGQKCTKHPDGKAEVSYLDGSVRIINVDGTEEQRFPDGRKTLRNLQGEQIILLPNGQREIHTPEHKRREYPDGTIRTLHKDGTVETVYANGRVRLKDANGVLLMDTHQT